MFFSQVFLLIFLSNCALIHAGFDNSIQYLLEHKKSMSKSRINSSKSRGQSETSLDGLNYKSPGEFFKSLHRLFDDNEKAELYKIALNIFNKMTFNDGDFNSILNYLNVYIFAAQSASKIDFTYKDLFLAFKPFYDLPARPAFLLMFKLILDVLHLWRTVSKSGKVDINESPEIILQNVQNGIIFVDKALRSSYIQDFF